MNSTTYTIYIKYLNSNGDNNKTKPGNQDTTGKHGSIPTKPRKITPGKSNNSEDDGISAKEVAGFISAARNPMSALVGSVSKAVAPVAIALACVKLADSVVSASLPIYENLTGDSSVSLNYSNFKSAVSAIMNPFSSTMNIVSRSIEIYNENLKINEQRALTGNSTINTYGGKSSN